MKRTADMHEEGPSVPDSNWSVTMRRAQTDISPRTRGTSDADCQLEKPRPWIREALQASNTSLEFSSDFPVCVSHNGGHAPLTAEDISDQRTSARTPARATHTRTQHATSFWHTPRNLTPSAGSSGLGSHWS